MKSAIRSLFGIAAALALMSSLLCTAQTVPANQPSPQNPILPRHVQPSYGKLSLAFEANQGQTDPQVKFLAHGSGYTIFLTAGQMVLDLRPSAVLSNAAKSSAAPAASQKTTSAVIQINMVGANPNPKVAGEDLQAAQAAQAALDLVDKLESHLSRFRPNSDIAQIAQLAPGETMRLCESAFTCLEIAKKMELATRGAFSATAAALQTQAAAPNWNLLPEELAIHCESGQLQFDLGAIGKGFALDRMGELLRNWDCPSFLLVAGGSSILAGDALLDEAAAQIGVDEATLGPFNGLAQTVVRDLLLPCKPREPSRLEDPHGTL